MSAQVSGYWFLVTILTVTFVTVATVTLAQSLATSRAKPAGKAEVARGVPLPPLPPVLREATVIIALPSPELLERTSEPNCEIPASDRLLGAIPERTQLIYERSCYQNAEAVVRSKLQLLQDAIAGTGKAVGDADAAGTLQPAQGRDQSAPAAAKDIAVPPKAGASVASSEGNAGDPRDAKGDLSADQGVEPATDPHRKPSAKLSGNLASREGAKSPSPDAAVFERAHQEKTRGTQTPNVSEQSKPVVVSAKAIACQINRPAGPGPRAWRLIDGRKCWYEGAAGMDRSLLHWPPS